MDKELKKFKVVVNKKPVSIRMNSDINEMIDYLYKNIPSINNHLYNKTNKNILIKNKSMIIEHFIVFAIINGAVPDDIKDESLKIIRRNK